MEADGDNAFVFPLLELPAPCLRSVLLHLWMDVRDVASLSCCCKATAEACDDDQLWKQLLMRRFGAGALPCEKPPSESSQPVSVEVWVFFQGVDVATDDNTFIQQGPHSMDQLAHLCDSQGSEAFTTGGRVVSKLGPSHTWKRVSLRPHEGLYVKQQVAAAMELQQPQQPQGPAAPWPPVVPGWVYYPCCDSPGFTAKDPAANLANHSSMGSLLSAAVVCLLPSVNPMGPRYRSFAPRLNSLKLYAGQMDACWLNDQYLSLEELSNDQIGCGGTVLKLNSVWWLDISGSITGVPPGKYDVLWVTKTTRPHNEDSWTIPLSMSATAEPLQHPDSLINTAASAEEAPATAAAPPSQTNSSVQATGGNSTVAASEGTAAGSSSSTGAAVSSTACQSEGCSSVTKTATWAAVYHPQQRPAADRSWGMISGRSITVTQLSTVHLRFWSHEHWKGNMEWAYAELRPHRSHDQQQHERQRRKQWQQWWKAHTRVQHPQQQQEQQQQEGFVFGTLSRWLRSLQQGP